MNNTTPEDKPDMNDAHHYVRKAVMRGSHYGYACAEAADKFGLDYEAVVADWKEYLAA